MANEVDYSPIIYNCNGTTVNFSFDWQVRSDEELIINLINEDDEKTLLTLGLDYSAVVENTGGDVILNTAPTAGFKLSIERKTPKYQSTRYSTSTGFQGSELEKSFDKVSCCLQDMDYNIEHFKETFSADINQKLQNDRTELEGIIETNRNDLQTQFNTLNYNTNQEIERFEGEINSAIEEFESSVDLKLGVMTSDINQFKIDTNALIEDRLEGYAEQMEQAVIDSRTAQAGAEAAEQRAIAVSDDIDDKKEAVYSEIHEAERAALGNIQGNTSYVILREWED